MNHQTLTKWFMWCTIINGIILTLISLLFFFGGDTLYQVHHIFMPLPRETYNLVMYGFIGLYKILWYLFNLTPWLGLLITKQN